MSTEKRNIISILSLLIIILLSGRIKSAYEYVDDFETDMAIDDSVSHSVFWPETAYPPDYPYLFYGNYITNGNRSLVFMDSNNIEADITYCLPLNKSDIGHKSIKGNIRCNVSFPYENHINSTIVCRLSPTGRVWNAPIRLVRGENAVPFFSFTGKIYVQFIGKGAVLDNLQMSYDIVKADIIVPEQYENIQKAIDNATDGQVIEVMPGVYSGNGFCNLDTRGKAITIRSDAGADETVIACKAQSGNAVQRGFYFHRNESPKTIIQGFTIEGGDAIAAELPDTIDQWEDSADYSIGGGIYCVNASPTISNCKIIGSKAYLGGGIGIVGGKPVIYNSIIEGCGVSGIDVSNIAAKGGGIALVYESNAQLIDCIVKGNKCENGGMGGGIYCYQSSPTILNCEIYDNNEESLVKGGGIYCFESDAAMIKNTLLYNNAAEMGGAIFVENSMANNTVFTIENCTIADNYCYDNGDPNSYAIIQISGINYNILNSIIWNKDYTQIIIEKDTDAGIVQYSDISGGYEGLNNIDVQPLFANVDTAAGRDYHLRSTEGRYLRNNTQWVTDQVGSPCIDVGKPTKILINEPWPNGKRANMGAYGQTEEASKSNRFKVIHVDIENGNDRYSGKSREQALKTIESGIAKAVNTNSILIWPGVYSEPIIPDGKKILIQSAAKPAIISAGNYALAFYKAEQRETVIRNLIIQNNYFGIYCQNTSPTLANLTIVKSNEGMRIVGDSDPLCINSIFWNNDVDIFCDSDTLCDISYCRYDEDRIQVNEESRLEGNIFDDPYYAVSSADLEEYTLSSIIGHFVGFDDPNGTPDTAALWQNDNVTSPCVDAGNPYINPIRESMPNGGRMNIGAYGGTMYASKIEWNLIGDFNYSGIVDMHDFNIFAKGWLAYGTTVNNDGAVDYDIYIDSLMKFTENWLDTLPWAENNNVGTAESN